nr:MAG TPA: hypothetical protein [Caudoviricetes sp.]
MVTKDSRIFTNYRNEYLKEKIEELEEKMQDLDEQQKYEAHKIGCKQAEIAIDKAIGYSVRESENELEKMIEDFNNLMNENQEAIKAYRKEQELYASLIIE